MLCCASYTTFVSEWNIKATGSVSPWKIKSNQISLEKEKQKKKYLAQI